MSEPKLIELLRIGNPWLVGKNVNRVVPIYALQNLLSPDFEKNTGLQALKHLAVDPEYVIAEEVLRDRIPTEASILAELRRTAYGVLAPERRVFLNKKKGGASEFGSTFPVVGALCSPAAGDDGLGKRLRAVMERYHTDWRDRLGVLMLPDKAHDPVTNFAMTLLGGQAGERKNEAKTEKSKVTLKGLDLEIAGFVDKLIERGEDARRATVIRDLAIGAFLASILRVVGGPCNEVDGKAPLVFVYGGLPPGRQHDPAVHAACKSYQEWVSASWHATGRRIVQQMGSIKPLKGSSIGDARRQRIRVLLLDRGATEKESERVITAIGGSLKRKVDDEQWLLDLFESKALGYPKSELARRIRSLGANIGFAGPDRGYGSPRLFLDTPLISVLVKGIVGQGAMEYGRFISELARRFGLVVGIGEDDSVVRKLELAGSSGYDGYELLEMNQVALRERMLRSGLARSYSDSHTEVICDG